MSIIHVLQPHIANQIAAGEVVERPYSVVKELVENSIDAGADSISIEIEYGGMRSIRVADNGVGIARDDCRNAFMRHATSKISTTDDLNSLMTLGFRGEALASIASVSRVTMLSRTKDSEIGTRIVIDNGSFLTEEDAACIYGTTFTVEALFATVPARLKFLKSARTEAGYIGDYLARMILARPDIAFKYISDGRTVYETFGDNDLFNALYSVYGKNIAEKVVPVSYDSGYMKINGFIGLPEISRTNRTYQTLLINGRYIRSFSISASVLSAYDTRIMIGKFPFYVLSLTISPQEYDVNVHPTKMEVRFADEQRVCGVIKTACRDALSFSSTHIESALDVCVPKSVQESSTNDYRSESKPVQITFNSSHHDSEAKYSGQNSIIFPRKIPSREEIKESVLRENIRDNTFESKNTLNGVSVFHVKGNEAQKETIKPHAEIESLFTDSRPIIIGCAFNGYWLVERDDNLYLIDQHAAHERELYQALVNQKFEMGSQPLLIPYDLRLTPSESDTLNIHFVEIQDLGYKIDHSNSLNCKVLAVPILNGIQLREQYLHEVLEILQQYSVNAKDQIIKERLMQSACKHAIKAGEPMKQEEIESLLLSYVNGELPLTCPHGRPVIIRITKKEIEKMFRRIV